MMIDDALIKHYLKNVLFINGSSYAGKSTMVQMLADRFGLLPCGENYDCIPEGLVTPEKYPNLGYFQTMKSWQEFVGRTPEAYDAWVQGCSRELIAFEVTYLMRISREQKVIVDTNLPADVLHRIADDNQVAIMLAPPALSIEQFFNRDDDKPEILEQIKGMDDPEWGLSNYHAILERICRQEYYDDWARSGFFTLVRTDVETDTREETLERLARHFGLMP